LFFWFRGCGAIFLRLLGAPALTYLSLLEFSDGDHAWNRLLDHIDDDSFGREGAGRFHRPALFGATFFTRPRLSLAPAKRFLGVGLATARFTDLPRTDLEALRVLRCVVAFRFRPVALFFP